MDQLTLDFSKASIGEVKGRIRALQDEMEYHGKHRLASHRLYLLCDTLSECDNIYRLLAYETYLRGKTK